MIRTAGKKNSGYINLANSYYSREVLQLSPGIDVMGNVVWQLALCLLFAWAVVFLVLIKGISSLGKVSHLSCLKQVKMFHIFWALSSYNQQVVYFTSTFPYVMMTILVINNCMLDGAAEGLIYYLKPDFSKLANAEVLNLWYVWDIISLPG